jgi:hypothetical protein
VFAINRAARAGASSDSSIVPLPFVSPTMQKALIVLARALPRPVDLMVAAGEEDERARGRARWSTESQYAANED